MFRWRIKEKILVISVVGLILFSSMIAAKFQILETVTSVFYQDKSLVDEELTSYTIEVDFDPVEKILIGKEKITYINHDDTELDALYFHLYPNAFKSKETVPFEQNEIGLAYPQGFEAGYIHIDSIQSNQATLNYVMMGIGDTILKVNLNQDLEPKETIDLTIHFMVKIPPSYGRFGYGEKTINIANWYPIISVFDDQGWNLEPYYAIGDPFYSDISDYRVIIAMPQEYNLAFSGELIKKELIDGKIHWTMEAEAVRDFTIVASEKFKIIEDTIDGIQIKSYYFEDEFGDLALQTAKDAIKIFNELFGKYPYKQFSVVASNFFVGGMEYPNLVLIDETLYTEEHKQILEYVIAHETAHQWWYGIVGSNQVREPWLDEALTEYTTILYYEKKYGVEIKNRMFENMIVKYYNAYKQTQLRQNWDERIYKSVEEFKDSREYQALVYYKGAMFLEDLRTQLGNKVFFQIMKVYFDKYKYKNATTEDFIDVCEQVSNQKVKESFKRWLKYDTE